ncbi:uncharacterized protein EI90DRAFT_3030857, partial [Cantharellus anzutake]|uniref:uncharacterized protein n=1 Tax=Cantharellus anzutake TaxID=1750568 RepID=UPI001902D100
LIFYGINFALSRHCRLNASVGFVGGSHVFPHNPIHIEQAPKLALILAPSVFSFSFLTCLLFWVHHLP